MVEMETIEKAALAPLQLETEELDQQACLQCNEKGETCQAAPALRESKSEENGRLGHERGERNSIDVSCIQVRSRRLAKSHLMEEWWRQYNFSTGHGPITNPFAEQIQKPSWLQNPPHYTILRRHLSTCPCAKRK